MTHLPRVKWKREETCLKLEVTRLIGVLFNRLVVAGGENCQDHQVEGGRSVSPRGKACLRCNDRSHVADRCPNFPYYSGSPCEKCGLLHKTSAHKSHSDRSGSARRYPVQKMAQNHQTEVRVTPNNEGYEQGPNMFKNSGYENIFGPKND